MHHNALSIKQTSLSEQASAGLWKRSTFYFSFWNEKEKAYAWNVTTPGKKKRLRKFVSVGACVLHKVEQSGLKLATVSSVAVKCGNIFGGVFLFRFFSGGWLIP